MFKKLILSSFLLAIIASVVACGAGKDQTNVEVIQGMMDQVSMKSQDYDQDRKEASNRVPPRGTVARNVEHYGYSQRDFDKASQSLKNPYRRDDLLARGEERYKIYCGVCHGEQGKGAGGVYLVKDASGERTTFIKEPPSLVADRVKAYSDGGLFHVVTYGFGQMNGYASQINKHQDRWAIVNYIRHLQKSEN